jgi:hypothetical protein
MGNLAPRGISSRQHLHVNSHKSVCMQYTWIQLGKKRALVVDWDILLVIMVQKWQVKLNSAGKRLC